ncbi:MAG: replication-associated recombination protein A [Oscillospiraceae bacterium]|nr:replication-associated recombination protein A [Oscillospiraceae bacterium]
MTPLAERIRPKNLDEVIGQKHLLAKNKPLRKIIESRHIPNMIFYGVSGVGKTTVASIIAQQTNMKLHILNGTQASVADIKAIISEIGTFAGMNGILLYLDEIQYLNKKQQQSLLAYIENGDITLIASTTENPYFAVYHALISRCTVFEFKPVDSIEIEKAVTRAFQEIATAQGHEFLIQEGVISHIAQGTGGDVRKAMNACELCALSAEQTEQNFAISLELAKALTQRSNMRYDRDGDSHYDILSALQKSIRGSDENAALHYTARLLQAGDLISLTRRLLVIASEDIGLAYPMAVPVVKACVENALQLGLPEARIPIAEAVILLATAPKSNSAYLAIDSAMADLEKFGALEIPRHLQNQHFDGVGASVSGQNYLYPHVYPNHYVKQQYLPDKIKHHVYYQFGENKQEQSALQYRNKILGKK